MPEYTPVIEIITTFSIITQVIIEILVLSLAENGVIFRYNHLRRGDYIGRTNLWPSCALSICLKKWFHNRFRPLMTRIVFDKSTDYA